MIKSILKHPLKSKTVSIFHAFRVEEIFYEQCKIAIIKRNINEEKYLDLLQNNLPPNVRYDCMFYDDDDAPCHLSVKVLC